MSPEQWPPSLAPPALVSLALCAEKRTEDKNLSLLDCTRVLGFPVIML